MLSLELAELDRTIFESRLGTSVKLLFLVPYMRSAAISMSSMPARITTSHRNTGAPFLFRGLFFTGRVAVGVSADEPSKSLGGVLSRPDAGVVDALWGAVR